MSDETPEPAPELEAELFARLDFEARIMCDIGRIYGVLSKRPKCENVAEYRAIVHACPIERTSGQGLFCAECIAATVELAGELITDPTHSLACYYCKALFVLPQQIISNVERIEQ